MNKSEYHSRLAWILGATTISLLSLPGLCAAQPAEVIAHWKFDETSGSLAIDSSLHGNDGTVSGALRVPGLTGGALLFEDFGDKVIVPHQGQQNITANRLTMEAIIRPAGTQAQFFTPVVVKNVPSQRDGYSMFIGNNNNIFAFFGDGSTRSIVANTPLPTGEWSHVAAWFDGTESRIYINCELDVTRGNMDTILPSSRFIELGGSDHPSRSNFNGSIDEIRITESALDPADFLNNGCNRRPVAQCRNVVVQAGEAVCVASASVDDGSYDPDGDAIILTQSPPGPYPLGEATVTLTAEDTKGLQDSCQASVIVVDVTAPVVECNAPPTIVPPDAPVSFTASSVDNCGSSSVFITEYDCFKITRKGKRIDKTDSCVVDFWGDTLTIHDSGGVGDNITWKVVAVDDSGNEFLDNCGLEVANPGH